MRSSLVFALVTALAACGTDSMGGGGDDDGGGDDGGSGSGSGSNELPPPKRGFQLQSPEIDIPAGQEITYCWYFKTPNTSAETVKRWVSRMTEGSHHLILYFTPTLAQPEGTVSASECGVAGAGIGSIPSWIYAAQTADATGRSLHYSHQGWNGDGEPFVYSLRVEPLASATADAQGRYRLPLPGVDAMVGLFINTVPVRLPVRGPERLGPWLAALQQTYAAARDYDQTPLAQVQAWSDVPRGTPLFENHFIFENYPVDRAGPSAACCRARTRLRGCRPSSSRSWSARSSSHL